MFFRHQVNQQSMSIFCQQLASIEDNEEIDGVLFLYEYVGGDVSAGLALAEVMLQCQSRQFRLCLAIHTA